MEKGYNNPSNEGGLMSPAVYPPATCSRNFMYGFALCTLTCLGACAPLTSDIRNNGQTGHFCLVWGDEARDGAKPCSKQVSEPPTTSPPDTPL
jgi:hypothetical protein